MRDHAKNSITITLDDCDESGMSVTNITTSPLTGNDYTFNLTDSISTIDTSGIEDLISMDDEITFNVDTPVIFEDFMPEVSKVEDMCNEYPALQKVYENFKSIYHMVHQDYVGNKKNEKEMPF